MSQLDNSDAVAVALGIASRDAKALALGFGGSYLAPSQTINALALSGSEFRKTFQAFAEILTRDESSIEFFDEFAQTWDECSDFLYDYDALRRGAAFTKRQPPAPTPSHKLARYVYTNKEIDRLRRRIELQQYIMHAKLDDILINAYLDVLPALKSNPDKAQPTIGLQFREDNDDNILILYQRLARFGNRSKRTPRTQSQAPANGVSQNLNPDDSDYLLQLLRARFERHELNPKTVLPDFYKKQDAQSLQNLSAEKLKNLLKTYWTFRDEAPNLTRKRAYARDDEYDGTASSFSSLPPPDLSFDSETTITILDDEVTVRSIDIVNYSGPMIVVARTEGWRSKTIIHYLPQIPRIYPFTYHERFKHFKSNREVLFKMGCTVEESTESHVVKRHEDVDPRYKFSSVSDALTFQSALRDKHLQGFFQVEEISSKRGRRDIVVSQVLKLWTDFTGASGSISFFRRTTDQGEPTLEFPLTDFAFPFETKDGDKNSIRMKFNRTAKATTKPPKQNSMSGRRPSIFKRFSSASSTNSIDSNAISDASPPDTTAHTPSSWAASDTVESISSTLGKPASTVNQDAKSFDHLDIQFSTLEDMKDFKSACRRIHRRSIELDSSPSHRYELYPSGTVPTSSHFGPLPLLPSPTRLTFLEEEWTITKRELEGFAREEERTVTMQMLKGFSFTPPRKKDEIAVLSGAMSPPPTPQSPTYTPRTQDLSAHGPKRQRSDLVFRVRGIPDDFSSDQTEELLRKILDVNISTGIDIRSLATSEYTGQRIAVVGIDPVPDYLLEKDKEWDSSEFTQGKHLGITIDNHFHGLTILYSPADSEHKLDICAVSGLGGHAFGSFKQRSGSWMWILDLLPHKFPSARIMTYGFDTKLHGNNSTQGFFSLGAELRANLEDLIGDSGGTKAHEATVSLSEIKENHIKPLIFIAHSLGGLIVREAMINADELESQLLEVAHGALFFGVPNQGMETEALCSVVKNQANASLVDNLKKDSDSLTKQTKQFDRIISLLKLDIIYFFEEKLSPQLALDATSGEWRANGKEIFMVDKSSATNGNYTKNPRAISRSNRNHSDLVKFGRHDGESLTALNELRRMVDRAMKKAANEPFTTPLETRTRTSTGLSGPSRAGTGFDDKLAA